MLFKKKPHILPPSTWKKYDLYLDTSKFADGWDEVDLFMKGKMTRVVVGFFKSEIPEMKDIIFIYTTHKAYKFVKDYYAIYFPASNIKFIQKECNL